MTGYLGRYEHQIDEKGRVSLPSAFRGGEDGASFVLLQWEEPYLTLFPIDVWGTIQERLLQYRRNQPEAWHRVRRITSRAVEVRSDKQGRILIPAWLKEAAALDGSVFLNGNLDRIEIWDPERYRETVETDSELGHDFAHQIFG